MRIIGRQFWAEGCKVTESLIDERMLSGKRRYTATIRGFRNWKIYEGVLFQGLIEKIIYTIQEKVQIL